MGNQVLQSLLNGYCTDDATPILEYMNRNKNPLLDIDYRNRSTPINIDEDELDVELKFSSIYSLEAHKDENIDSFDKTTEAEPNDEVLSDLQQ